MLFIYNLKTFLTSFLLFILHAVNTIYAFLASPHLPAQVSYYFCAKFSLVLWVLLTSFTSSTHFLQLTLSLSLHPVFFFFLDVCSHGNDHG